VEPGGTGHPFDNLVVSRTIGLVQCETTPSTSSSAVAKARISATTRRSRFRRGGSLNGQLGLESLVLHAKPLDLCRRLIGRIARSPQGTHAPHHVPRGRSDKSHGRFDAGWEAVREETLARQKQLGVVPADAERTARHPEIPAWNDMPGDHKPELAGLMEVYAGLVEHTDHHVGRLIDTLEDLGALDDTIAFYIIGDNGASAERTISGTFNQ
jgi:hypothetical protein